MVSAFSPGERISGIEETESNHLTTCGTDRYNHTKHSVTRIGRSIYMCTYMNTICTLIVHDYGWKCSRMKTWTLLHYAIQLKRHIVHTPSYRYVYYCVIHIIRCYCTMTNVYIALVHVIYSHYADNKNEDTRNMLRMWESSLFFYLWYIRVLFLDDHS